MGGRIRGASGLSSEVQLGAGGSKVKSSADGTVQVLESDGSTKGTLDIKDLAISGTATGISKSMVGLGSVDNTADTAKPVSTAQQTALDAKQASSEKGQANGYCPLDGSGKIASSFLHVDAVEYQGNWNASTNSPSLADGTGDKGDMYVVSVAGTQNLGQGSVDYNVGDSVIYSGNVWDRIGRSDVVTSVAGKTGAVSLVKGDVGLGNVDNVSNADAAISTATQTALDLKAPLADAALTGATTAVGLTVTNAVAAGSGSITGDLTVDTSTLKVDSSNNRVGVGTASPADLLHASGGNAHVDGGSIKITETAGGSNTVTLTQGSDAKLAINKALKVTSPGASSIAGALTVTGNILTDGTVDGVDIAAFKTSFDNSKVRQVSITHSDAGSATNFGTALASGAFVSRLVVKITEAFDSNVGTLQVGDSSDADGFGSVAAADLQVVGTQIIFDAPFNNKPLSSSVQAQYTLSGSSSAGACTISIQQEAI